MRVTFFADMNPGDAAAEPDQSRITSNPSDKLLKRTPKGIVGWLAFIQPSCLSRKDEPRDVV